LNTGSSTEKPPLPHPPTEIFFKNGNLWEEILAPDSLPDIIENYAHLSREVDKSWDPYKGKVVEKWNEITDPEQKNEFKSLIQSYLRLYGYISQIITFEDIELEKLFIFLKYVNKKLPKGDPGFVDISGSVELSSLRIQKIVEYRLGLEDVSGVLEPMTASGGGGKTEEPLDFLSEIVRKRRDIRRRAHRGTPARFE